MLYRTGRSKSVPLHRVAIVRPFAQWLSGIGVPVERGFRLVGLPFGALEDVNHYVPSERFLAFVVNMAHREGIEDLGFRVGQRYGANCVDPHFSDVLRRLPTLYRGILKFSELTNKTVYRSHVGLLQSPFSEHAYFFHRPSCDPRSLAINHIGWFGLTTLIAVIRLFTGPRWHPSEIGVMTHHPPCRSIREQFYGTRIRLSQPCSYVALETALLSRPPLNPESTAHGSTPHIFEPYSNDFVGLLKQLLHSYLHESELSVECAAELCHVSKRTLQRRLSDSGTNYSAVLDQARFGVAREMLQNPDMRVTDVAHLLGYSNSTHFSRTFRRIAGVSPRAYREAYAH
jgi:AraC-like DNA-binding protein